MLPIIIKDKNLIKFYKNVNDSQFYAIDINTNQILNKTGRPLKSIPSTIRDFLTASLEEMNTVYKYHNVLDFLHDCNYYDSFFKTLSEANYLNTLDKLESLGIFISIEKKYNFLSLYRSDLRLIEKNWKTFCKWYVSLKDKSFLSFKNLTREFSNYFYNHWKKEHNLITTSSNLIECMYILYRNNNNQIKKCKIADYYLNNGLLVLLPDEQYAWSKIKTYFKYCNDLAIEPKKTNDFLREYVKIFETWKLNEEKIAPEKLEATQKSKFNKLFFENAEYITIIPTTTEAFIAEANAQHNCVASSYLPKVTEGRTNIVFVRHKNNLTKSLITCEVDLNGKIQQFLLACNSNDLSIEQKLFKEEYQKFLSAQEW